MGTYTRLGSCLLASELASDPFGTIQRAVVIAGSTFDHHVLVRTFSEELFQAGLNTRLAEANRVVPLLGGARIFGTGYRIETGKTPYVVWEHVPGRSLAQLIDKAKQEQIPFGVDHALTVIQGVAQGIVQMQAKGVSHGILSPHSVWVSFEGATQVVDAPFASLIRSMLGKAPSVMNKLASYLQGTDKDPLQQDLFALGAVLYELLTFERLPVGGSLQAVLDKATLKAAQEEIPFPAEIRALLGRLLLGRQPFLTIEGFHAELERVLYEGEYSPTTFNMAFFMHTLFREENDRDAAAMKTEEGDNYLAYTAAGESLRSGATRVEHMDGGGEPESGKKSSFLLMGGGLVAAAVILGLGYFYFASPKEDPALKKQMAELQLLKTQMEQQKAEVDAKTKAQSEKTAQLQKQLSETKSAEEKLKLEKQLEESKQRKLDLERQQKAAVQRLAEQKQNEQRLNEQRRASSSKPAPPPPPPQVTEIPKPQPPAPEQPKPVVTPTPTPQQSTGSDLAPVNEAARILTQAQAGYPQRALQSHVGTDRDQRVRLKVFVGDRGQVLKVSLIEGVGGLGGFDEAAIEAANKSTFSPATRDGKPVRGWTPEIVYSFKKQN